MPELQSASMGTVRLPSEDGEAAELSAALDALASATRTARQQPGASSAVGRARELAQQLNLRLERAGFSEVASAVWSVDEVLQAVMAGELPSAEPAWRQIEAGVRAAVAAWKLAEVSSQDCSPAPTADRVLLVDPTGSLVDEVRRVLRRQRLALQVVAGVAEAIEVGRQHLLQAVVVVGPAKKAAAQGNAHLGWEPSELQPSADLIRELKRAAAPSRLPAIFVGPHLSFQARLLLTRAGTDLFLGQPVSSEALLEAVSYFVMCSASDAPRILLAGTPATRAGRRRVLERAGMRVSSTDSGERLLETLERELPELLLLHRCVGDLDARDLCRMVRAVPLWQDLPVVVLDGPEEAMSCSKQTLSRSSYFEAGADDVIVENFDDDELVARIRVKLERARRFRDHSNRDLLTGLLSRRAVAESMHARLSEAARAKKLISLCLLDLDRFKHINDTFGHASGDRVLAAFGGLLNASLRTEDLRGRWGGEEFLIAFYDEWAEGAREILARITSGFAKIAFEGDGGQSFRATVSAGIATYPVDGETLEDLLLVADRRLYRAKRSGRNRIRI